MSADLNMDQVSNDSVKYDGTKVPLQTQVTKENLQSANGSASGVAGVAGNIPPISYPAGSSKNGPGTVYLNTTGNTTYGANKTISHTVVAPGAVNQLHVALLFDSSVPAKAQVGAAGDGGHDGRSHPQPRRHDLDGERAVPEAGRRHRRRRRTAGHDRRVEPARARPRRADRPGRDRVPLPDPPQPEVAASARRASPSRPGCGRSRDATPIAALEAGTRIRARQPSVQHREIMQKEAEEIVRSQPEHVALQVQQWMNE